MSAMTYTVTEKQSGKRLDLFIAHYAAHISRNRIQSMVKDGHALVNGRMEKPSYKVKLGEVITLDLPERTIHEVLPEAIPLNVMYEDSYILVLNKPHGLVVHPAPGNYTGTLVNALLYHYGTLPLYNDGFHQSEREKTGIVHRLDKDTSGVIVVARTSEALRSLSMQFKNRMVRKEYVAIVVGVIKKGSGTINTGIGRHVKDRKKISVLTHKAREAITDFVVRERYQQATLVGINIRTGRTHQIRVHMAHKGYPVLGDRIYGGARVMKLGACAVTRQMLHAESLSFFHPHTGHPMTFTAPLPVDMIEVINKLRKMKTGGSKSKSFTM